MERVQLVSIEGEKQDSNVRNKQDRLVHVAMHSVHVPVNVCHDFNRLQGLLL